MEYVITFFTWVALSWLFFPIACLSLITTYFNIKNDERDFPIVSGIVLGLVVWLSILRFDFPQFSWANLAYFVGGYIIIGFFVALFKWVQRLKEFKKVATEIKEKKDGEYNSIFSKYREQNYNWSEEQLKSSTLESIKRSTETDLSYRFSNVLYDTSTKKFYLGVNKVSVSTHWVYWPFFVLSIVFEPIASVINFLVDYTKNFFTSISKRFSV